MTYKQSPASDGRFLHVVTLVGFEPIDLPGGKRSNPLLL